MRHSHLVITVTTVCEQETGISHPASGFEEHGELLIKTLTFSNEVMKLAGIYQPAQPMLVAVVENLINSCIYSAASSLLSDLTMSTGETTPKAEWGLTELFTEIIIFFFI